MSRETLAVGGVDELGNPLLHEQTMTRWGIWVDTGLVELLEALWEHDFETWYSCEGGLDLPYYTVGPSFAYLAMPVADMQRFVSESVERGVPEEVFIVVVEGDLRGIVKWEPQHNEVIRKAWT